MCCLACIVNAQEYKRNNNWVTGFAPVIKLNFQVALSIDTFTLTTFTKSSSNISDTNGQFLFYSTGFSIMDKYSDTMNNGNYVNSPYGNVLANYYGLSSLFDQTSIILPKKGNQYYVFSTGMSDSVANNYLNHVYTEFDVLNYSVVDMDSNNGKGKVVQKNVVLADKQHYYNTALQAVKHANGKDWWLVKADCSYNRYQEFLVKEDTILGPFYQYYQDTSSYCYWIGQLYFNQEGTKMACSNKGDRYYNNGIVGYVPTRVDIYDFNRCNGELIHKKKYIVPYDTSTYPGNDFKMGICFSPNSKLLYVSNTYSIYQIDLEDTNTNNAIFIHGPDTSDLSYFAWYHNMATAPDGKLYIGNYHSTRKYMSYIDKPNVKGLGCQFMPQGLWQPYTNLKSPPNMPNYGLGKDTTQVCWPLSNYAPEGQTDPWVVYPNPSHTLFYFKNKTGHRKYLYNTLGQLIRTTQSNEMDIRGVHPGVYYVQCDGETRKVIVE
jgi:hypothetical protein